MIRMNREKPDYSGRWKREKCECLVGGGGGLLYLGTKKCRIEGYSGKYGLGNVPLFHVFQNLI